MFFENGCGFQLQLNVMMYDRKQLSGQKHCCPSQVLGEKKETVGPFIILDGYFSISFNRFILYHKLQRRIAFVVDMVKNYCLITLITYLRHCLILKSSV